MGTISVCHRLSTSAGLSQYMHNLIMTVQNLIPLCFKHKKILERTIPDSLKLSIARKIENNLFSKVQSFSSVLDDSRFLNKQTYFLWFQISFLVGLKEMGEIRTLFTAEVYTSITPRTITAFIMECFHSVLYIGTGGRQEYKMSEGSWLLIKSFGHCCHSQ